MNLSNFVAYVKQAWKNKPDTSTPLSAERLTHQEEGIKGNSDAIQELAAAVVSQIVNNPDKIASMAALYAVNQKVTTLDGKVGDTAQLPSGTADVASAVAQLYSNLARIGKVYWSNVETYNVDTINTWIRGNHAITFSQGIYVIGYRAETTCLNSIYVDTKIDTVGSDLNLYEKGSIIPPTTANINAKLYRTTCNTFIFDFTKDITLYFYCWADSPINVQY